jgi:hypothetical protein
VQKCKIVLSFLTYIVPVPGSMAVLQNEHFAILSTASA